MPELIHSIKEILEDLKPHGFSDLRQFINHLEKRGDLVRVTEQVDPDLEINAILDRLARTGGPAVLFENVKGSSIPLLGNVFGTWRRLSRAFGAEDFGALVKQRAGSIAIIVAGRGKDILIALKTRGIIAKLRSLRRALRKSDWRKSYEEIKNNASMIPIEVPRSKAPCKEVVITGEDINLHDFPMIKCWPLDGGRYATLPLVITRDPETGGLNVGIYRMMLLDKNRMCMHWLPQKHGNRHHAKAETAGRELPVVVAFGGDPALEVAGAFQLMPPLDEFMVAGLLKGSGIEYTPAEDSDLWVPAGAEIVFEGVVKPGERTDEGPFGEFNGYYSPVKRTPVFHVKKITMRRKPLWHAATTGMPVTEIHVIAKAMERLSVELAKVFYPGVTDLNLTVESGTLYSMVAALKKTRPYEAQELMHFIWSFAAQSPYVTNIIVVDHDVDIHDMEKVARAMSDNVRPGQDVTITPRGLADLEKPSTYPRGVGARLGVDATSKWPGEGPSPDRHPIEDGVAEKVRGSWREFGDGLKDVNLICGRGSAIIIASLKKSRSWQARDVMKFFRDLTSGSRCNINILVVDDTVDIRDLFRLAWAFSMHMRPEFDIVIDNPGPEPNGSRSPGVGIDATTKTAGEGLERPMPELVRMDPDVEARVIGKWERYGFKTGA